MAVPSHRCHECRCTAPQDVTTPFCVTCGHARNHHVLVCGACSEPLGDATGFCSHCGAPIERVTEQLAPPLRPQAAPVPARSPAPPIGTSTDPHRCTVCSCAVFAVNATGSGCATCLHPASVHGLTADDVNDLRGPKPPRPRRPAPQSSGLPKEKPLGVAPKGLITVAWVSGIFGVLAVLVGIIAYTNSSNDSVDTYNGVQHAADTAALIGGIGIGGFWFMISLFCAGLHGHLDRLARIALLAHEPEQVQVDANDDA